MGGVAMAAAIEAAERSTEQPLLWSTMHYISGGALGDIIDIQVDKSGGGRSISQVGVRLSTQSRLLQTLAASLGGRTGYTDKQFVQMPDVLSPDACPEKDDNTFANDGNLLSQFERRTAFECPETGTEHMWIRPKFETEINAALLAITSDFILGAHRASRGGTSLDNTLRIHNLQPTSWILCATTMSGISNGSIQGVQYQFAENGTLLSTSSQTGLLPRTPNP